jgi:hypothetical protein
VSQLVRDNPRCDPGLGNEVSPGIAQSADERETAAGAGEEKAVSRERILGAQQAEAVHQMTYEGIHRDKTFSFRLTEGHVDSPAIWADQAETVEG